jgi:hypothetical protein
MKVVQMMLGHKTATKTLDLYGHLFPDRLTTVPTAWTPRHVPQDSNGGDREEESPR